MNIMVEGVTHGQAWSCGFEFDYQGENTMLCRPVRKAGFENVPVAKAEFTEVPALAEEVRVALLPAMSGSARGRQEAGGCDGAADESGQRAKRASSAPPWRSWTASAASACR